MPTTPNSGRSWHRALGHPERQEAALLLGVELPGGAARCPFVEAHAAQLMAASGAAAVVVTLDRDGTLTVRQGSDGEVATHRLGAAGSGEAGLRRRRYLCCGAEPCARSRAAPDHQR